MYNLKTVDKYSISLIEAFDQEHKKYYYSLANEDVIKLQALNFNAELYFDKTDIFSQSTIDTAYKGKFFFVFGSNLSDIYHEAALQGSSIDTRFAEMEKHIANLIHDYSMCEILSKRHLESSNTEFSNRGLRHAYWGSRLDKHLLFESLRILQKVKTQVDSQNNLNSNIKDFQVDSQNNSNSTSGDCFIVTATFGTPYAKEVIKYRNFRDQYLSNYLLGRGFIYLYNFWGPGLAVIVNKNPRLKGSMAKVLGAVSQVLPETKDYII